MPLQIIRNDITKVKADIIVNSANPLPKYANGTDYAIYQAAGVDELLAARKEIGNIEVGEVAITPAFNLQAKYIIHTVGPVWVDGNHNELEKLKSCYEKSLLLASEKKCKSIAFPLISTGVYRFPKDEALNIAISTITPFLLTHDMLVTLVVYNKEAFQLSQNITDSVQSYIDEHYIEEQESITYASYTRRNESRHRRVFDEDFMLSSRPLVSGSLSKKKRSSRKEVEDVEESKSVLNLDDLLNKEEDNFTDRLLKIIDGKGLKDSTVYTNANMSRQTFHKILKSSKVSKNSVFQLAISLKLSKEETIDLLQRAGYSISPANKTDIILQYFIESKQYDVYMIDEVLFKYDQPTLFSEK